VKYLCLSFSSLVRTSDTVCPIILAQLSELIVLRKLHNPQDIKEQLERELCGPLYSHLRPSPPRHLPLLHSHKFTPLCLGCRQVLYLPPRHLPTRDVRRALLVRLCSFA